MDLLQSRSGGHAAAAGLTENGLSRACADDVALDQQRRQVAERRRVRGTYILDRVSMCQVRVQASTCLRVQCIGVARGKTYRRALRHLGPRRRLACDGHGKGRNVLPGDTGLARRQSQGGQHGERREAGRSVANGQKTAGNGAVKPGCGTGLRSDKQQLLSTATGQQQRNAMTGEVVWRSGGNRGYGANGAHGQQNSTTGETA